MTNLFNIILTVATAVIGLHAAGLWLASSKITADPGWDGVTTREPVDPSQSNAAWISGIMEANTRSARLNRLAAKWTAVSVALGACTALVGLAPPSWW